LLAVIPVGTAHRKADWMVPGGVAMAVPGFVVAGVVVARGFGRGPLVRTRIAGPSKATSTVPSVSVR
jgi:hypothetical protein